MGGRIRVFLDPGGPQVPHDVANAPESVVHVETRPGKGFVAAGAIGLLTALVAPLCHFPAGVALLALGTTTCLTVVAALACPRRMVAFDLRTREVWIGSRRIPIAALDAARLGARRDGTIDLAIRVAGAWCPLLEGVVPAHRATLEELAETLRGAREAEGGYRNVALVPFEILRELPALPPAVRARPRSPARPLERALLASMAMAAIALGCFGHFAAIGAREAAGFSMGIATLAAGAFSSIAFRLDRALQ